MKDGDEFIEPRGDGWAGRLWRASPEVWRADPARQTPLPFPIVPEASTGYPPPPVSS